MMHAVEIVEPGRIRSVEKERPTIRAGEVMLKMKYVGFCGSDLSTYLGKNPLVNYPRMPGHEISAVVVEIGEEVPDTIQIGQQVTVIPYTNCGQCTACQQNQKNACRYNETLGVQREGAMTEYICLPWQKVLPDDQLSAIQLALVEPLTVGFHAIDRGAVSNQDTVVVLGSGMIGMGAILGAVRRGATVIAVDMDEEKLAIAKKLGAAFTIHSVEQDLHQELAAITNGQGPSVVVEAVGQAATYQAAMEEVCFAGRVVCIGYAGSDIAFPTKLWVQKELKILGSRNATPSDFTTVMEFLKSNPFEEELVVSKIVSVREAPEIMAYWSENRGKVLKIMVSFDN